MEDGGAADARKIAMGFKNFSVTTENPTTALVYNVSGYVEKGGITAVMGASASGAPVYLECIAPAIYLFNNYDLWN